MKKRIFVILLGAAATLASANDLLGLPPLEVPAGNPQSPAKIELGRRLFNESRFSGDGTVSCATCHQSTKAFTDGLSVARGIRGHTGTRNTPTAFNAAFYTSFFWDGRRDSLETQALDPLTNPIEHGLDGYESLLKLVRSKEYRSDFEQVFDIQPDQITIDHVAKAIAAYERTLIGGNSRFDRFFFGRDKSALSPSEARGLNIFRRKGNCANCHEISWNNALFTDNRFYNIGVGFEPLKRDSNLIESLRSGSADQQALSPIQKSALGRFNISGVPGDIGKFKTPTLRNIALTAPYMHDGSHKTLQEVIEYYDRGGDPNPFLDPAIFPLHLTVDEKNDLEAFLNALTSGKFEQPIWK